MKYQILMLLVVFMIIPVIFQLAMLKDNQNLHQLPGDKGIKAKNVGNERLMRETEIIEISSDTKAGTEHIILQNKQINFWIP